MNLKTIAKEAGVSTATVSNVINGNYHKVSKETIEKVLRIIEANNYKPNATARSLASKQSKIIGVVIPYVGPDDDFAMSPYNAQMLSLLENYIRKQGYYLMARCVGQVEEVVPLFSTWNVDGMILFGVYKHEVQEIKKKLKVPTVYIDTYAEEYEISNVGINDYKGGYLLAKYLLGKGHREIAFAGPSIQSPGVINERYRGFCDACREAGVTVTPDHIFEGFTNYQNGVSIGTKIGCDHIAFTAVATMSDVLAFGIMEGLKLCGKRIPDDVSVIGFDNLRECDYSTPKLTSISQNLPQKALAVGEQLFSMIQTGETMPANIVVDVEIVERQSVKELEVTNK